MVGGVAGGWWLADGYHIHPPKSKSNIETTTGYIEMKTDEVNNQQFIYLFIYF